MSDDKALKEILELYNLEDILVLMGFEVVSTEVEDVYDGGWVMCNPPKQIGLQVGYIETITVKREIKL